MCVPTKCADCLPVFKEFARTLIIGGKNHFYNRQKIILYWIAIFDAYAGFQDPNLCRHEVPNDVDSGRPIYWSALLEQPLTLNP